MSLSASRKESKKNLLFYLINTSLYFTYILARILPLDIASSIGGWLAEKIGLLFSKEIFMKELALVLPHTTIKQRKSIIREMYNNLGRVLFEIPHIKKFIGNPDRIELKNTEFVIEAIKKKKPIIFISAHLSNWELSLIPSQVLGLKIATLYTDIAVPLNRKVRSYLADIIGAEYIPKTPEGHRRLIQILQDKGNIALLVDQKRKKGVPVPFFGYPAMTSLAPARLAYKYDCLIIPARVERLRGAHFRITICPPLNLPQTDDQDADIYEATVRINKILEEWIRESPGQWLWRPNRWKLKKSSTLAEKEGTGNLRN